MKNAFRTEVEKQEDLLNSHIQDAIEAEKKYRINFNNLDLIDFERKREFLDQMINYGLETLKTGDLSQLPLLVGFLKHKGRYFRSGYLREKICLALRKVNLNEEQKEVIRELILMGLITYRREFRELSYLVPKVYNAEFEKIIRSLENHPEEYVRKRVKHLLEFDSFQ